MSKDKKGLSDTCKFGDTRLNSRLEKICKNFEKYLESSIPQSHGDRSQMKASYNFFKNEKVTPEKIIRGHRDLHQKDRSKVTKQVLLCAQDKSEFDFTGKKSSKGFGPLNHLKQRGCLLQNSLLMSEKGVPIGLFKQSSIIREEASFSKRSLSSVPRKSIEEKETYHWVSHFEELQNYFRDCTGVEVFCTNDREGDIYELFAKQDSDNVHLIVRSKHNRLLEEVGEQRLHDKVKNSSVKHTSIIKVTDRRTSKQRKAKVQIRYTDVTIKLGVLNKFQKHLSPIKLWAIEVEEINPPKGYKAVQWILLTTYPVSSVMDALRINRYYVLRWIVERFHYILKSGAKVKDLQLTTPQRVLNAIATYSISAVNIMRMNYLAREYPQMSAIDMGFEQWQLKVLFAYIKSHVKKDIVFNIEKPPNLRQVVILIARIGGFTNFSNQAFPGLKTFWKGWYSFNIILNTVYALNNKQI